MTLLTYARKDSIQHQGLGCQYGKQSLVVCSADFYLIRKKCSDFFVETCND